jgi:small subunit ribosomal protein S17
VVAVECRPLSKTKSFRLKTIVSTGVNIWFKVLQD